MKTDSNSPTAFDAGVMAALSALRLVLEKTPGFDTEQLTEAAEYFKKIRSDPAGKAAYDAPLNVLISDHREIASSLEADRW
jgi:hypothetical protein